jgi:hypothetical protein
MQKLVEEYHRQHPSSPGYMFMHGSVSHTKRNNLASSIVLNGRATMREWMWWGRPEKIFGLAVLVACALYYIWKHA